MILGLILEPLPGAAVGWIGISVVTLLSRFVLFSPAQLADPGFDRAEQAIRWGLSGFSNTTVWLIFSAFTFGLGYEKTGLGRRIALELVRRMGGRTLTLGYAVMLADAILAPFTPSSTARGAGTIYPIVRNLPPLYDSLPNDPSARLMGSYIMWTAISATSISSTLFLTGMAPNPLAAGMVRESFGVTIGWMDWFTAMAPFGIPMLFLVPLMSYVLYPPELKRGERLPGWAAGELAKLGPLSIREMALAFLVVSALALWIFGGSFIDATTVGIVVVSLMIVLGVVTWNDVLGNRPAWNTFVWFASLVTLAAGLSSVGFLKWVATRMTAHLTGFTSTSVIVALALAYFLFHYMFASITAHTTALFPMMLADRLGRSGNGHERARPRSRRNSRNHGYSYAVCFGPIAGVSRKRLLAFQGLLAPRSSLWRASSSSCTCSSSCHGSLLRDDASVKKPGASIVVLEDDGTRGLLRFSDHGLRELLLAIARARRTQPGTEPPRPRREEPLSDPERALLPEHRTREASPRGFERAQVSHRRPRR